MNNKGFIATSLIYSFFLVFCMVLVGYVALNVHNKNLLDITNSNIRSDLVKKQLKDVPIGTYINVNLSHQYVNVDDVNWFVFSQGSDTLLVSDSIIMSYDEDINSEVINNINQNINGFTSGCLESNSIRIINYNDMELIRNNSLTKVIVDRLANIDINYLVVYNTNYYYYSFPTDINEDLSLASYKSAVFENRLFEYSSEDKINVRLVLSVNSDSNIIGGTGISTNPYNLGECSGV